MDANKLATLREVEYKIHKICMWCKHRMFPSEEANFGECVKHKYFHLKHRSTRFLSISIAGSCPKWELDEDKLVQILGVYWLEFIKET